MLGTTAQGVFWMFRYLERSENMARLIEAGHRIAMTRTSTTRNDEWASVLATAGSFKAYSRAHGPVEDTLAVDYLLRDINNRSSVLSMMGSARHNARIVRTALTREVWEATNEAWLAINAALASPVTDRDLPDLLELIRTQSALVQGMLHGTMVRNEVYDFARLGTFIERADNTARILDVKYWVLVPSGNDVESRDDAEVLGAAPARARGFDDDQAIQWESILRSVSALGPYRRVHPGPITPAGIVEMLILNRRMPRSLAFSFAKVTDNLSYLVESHGQSQPSHKLATELSESLEGRNLESLFDEGVHDFVAGVITSTAELAGQIETDFRFQR